MEDGSCSATFHVEQDSPGQGTPARQEDAGQLRDFSVQPISL